MTMDLKESLAARVVDAGGKLTVRSALNPILWLCAIVTIPCLFLSSFFESIRQVVLILAALPVGTAVLGFLFLLIVDRDKLQSEEYQIRKQTLEYMQQKGQQLPAPIETSSVITPPEQAKKLKGGAQ